jgi:hypothetical protein
MEVATHEPDSDPHEKYEGQPHRCKKEEQETGIHLKGRDDNRGAKNGDRESPGGHQSAEGGGTKLRTLTPDPESERNRGAYTDEQAQ